MNHQSTDTFMKKNEMSNTRIRVKTTLQRINNKNICFNQTFQAYGKQVYLDLPTGEKSFITIQTSEFSFGFFLHLKAHLWLGIKGKINVHIEVGWFTSTYHDSFLLI